MSDGFATAQETQRIAASADRSLYSHTPADLTIFRIFVKIGNAMAGEELYNEIPSLDLADFTAGDPDRKVKFVQEFQC
ncbi:MAG: hypothetical protein EOO39_28385 [Cytophagaceae bacterium]|nr:MAG: hypothetical protein EOO39_28385 [Cytophagaceae bacterium]